MGPLQKINSLYDRSLVLNLRPLFEGGWAYRGITGPAVAGGGPGQASPIKLNVVKSWVR